MNSEENFKNLLNDKLSEKEFVFEPAAWESAKAFIDKKRQRRRGLYFVLPALLFILGGLGYFLMPESVQKPTVIAKTATITHDLKVPVESNNVTTDKTEVLKTKKVEAKNPETVAPIVPIKQKETLTAVPETKIQNTIPLVKIEPVKEKPVKAGSSSQPIQNPVSTSVTIAANTNRNESKIETLIQNPIVQTPVVQTPIVQKEELKKPTEIVQTNDQLPLQIMTEEKTLNTVSITPTYHEVVKEKSEEVIPVKQVDQISNTISPSNAVEQKQIVDTAATNKAVTESAVNNTIVPLPTSFLFLEAGSNYNFGWKNPGSVDAKGFNPIFGLFLHSNIYKQFGFSFGVQYSSVRNLNFSQHTSKVTRYGLGEESDVTVITPTTLHYIYIPLKLSYVLKEKNVFTIGYNIGYLLNVDSKVETYNEHFSFNDNYKSYQSGGYTEGFGIFDSQITVGYRRKVYRNFWMNAEMFLGLSDVKNNTFFESKVFERNKGLKISLMYNIFKK